MKNALIILVVCFTVVCAAFAVALLGQSRTSRAWQSAHQALQIELRSVQVRLDVLTAEKQAVMAQLSAAQALSANLQDQLQDAKAPKTAPDTPPAIPPLRANAYLGQQWIGQAWVLAYNVRFDTNIQRYVYDPVVALDENLRGSFVVTNLVEREIETQATYNYNNTYYPSPVYYYVPPYRRLKPDSHPPVIPPAPTPSPYPAPPPFNPGSGSITPPKLGTPVDQIKTRPQLPGQPSG